jgi:hypothetical protein
MASKGTESPHARLERSWSVPVDAAFQALRTAVDRRFEVQSSDDVARTVTFSSKASLFTWGETFIAQVVASGEGSTVRVRGSAKSSGPFADLLSVLVGAASTSTNTDRAHNARSRKLVSALFDDISSSLRDRSPSA